jgi:hypothetical protein
MRNLHRLQGLRHEMDGPLYTCMDRSRPATCHLIIVIGMYLGTFLASYWAEQQALVPIGWGIS